jgi:hypothetical protein
MQSPITLSPDGHATWTHQPGDSYAVTGITTTGKRFRFSTDRWPLASAINVYRGTYWLIRDGKRHKIQSRYN